MEQIIYSKYSNERNRRFAVRTDIVEGAQGYCVKKTALYPEGKEHVNGLFSLYRELEKEYRKIGLACNRCEQTEDGVVLEYLDKETLEENLDDLLVRGETEAAGKKLTAYLQQVKELYDREPFVVTEEYQKVFGREEVPEGMTGGKLTNIDMVCSNLVLTEPETVLDYEWTFAFPIPCQFVLYRIIHYYIDTHKVRQALDRDAFYREFGITEEQRRYFEGAEAHFQEYLTEGHVPVREMFASMTPGIGSVQMAAAEELRIFFFKDGGYREEDSVGFPIREEKASCTVELPKDCSMVRIDPGDQPCGVYIETLSFDGEKAKLSEAYVPEGVITGRWVYIAKPDPNIANIPVPEGAEKLTVSLKIYPGSAELLHAAAETGKENRKLRARLAKIPKAFWKLKNTGLWKIYRKCTGREERK